MKLTLLHLRNLLLFHNGAMLFLITVFLAELICIQNSHNISTLKAKLSRLSAKKKKFTDEMRTSLLHFWILNALSAFLLLALFSFTTPNTIDERLNNEDYAVFVTASYSPYQAMSLIRVFAIKENGIFFFRCFNYISRNILPMDYSKESFRAEYKSSYFAYNAKEQTMLLGKDAGVKELHTFDKTYKLEFAL